MEEKKVPQWLTELSEEDFQFLKRLVLASGSLKELAGEYGISYPTVRIRLDRLIEKIKVLDGAGGVDPFHLRIRLMVADGQIAPATARSILKEHEKSLRRRDGDDSRDVV